MVPQLRVAATVFIILVSRETRGQVIDLFKTPEEAVAAGVGRDLKSAITNVKLGSIEKQQLDGQISAARGSFLASCAGGERSSYAEEKFSSALLAKDLYYLPFYSAGAGQTLVLDRGTGGAVDGGIPANAQLSFQVWAGSFSELLRSAASGDSAALSAAADHSVSLYASYVILRDEAEIDHWRLHRKILVGAPGGSPEALANTYVDSIINPAISSIYGCLPDRLEAMRQWSKSLRDEILAFEKLEPSVDIVAASFRQYNYPHDLVEAFVTRVKAASQDGKTNQLALEQAYVKTIQENDKRGGAKPVWQPPSMTNLRASLKGLASREEEARLGKLEYASPYPLSHPDYWFVRSDMIKGVLLVDAPPPPLDADWCTGRPKRRSP